MSFLTHDSFDIKFVDEPWDDKWVFRLICREFKICRNEFKVDLNEYSDPCLFIRNEARWWTEEWKISFQAHISSTIESIVVTYRNGYDHKIKLLILADDYSENRRKSILSRLLDDGCLNDSDHKIKYETAENVWYCYKWASGS